MLSLNTCTEYINIYILLTRKRLCRVMWTCVIIFSGKKLSFTLQLYQNMDHTGRRNKYNVSKSVINLQVINSSNNIEK